MTPLETDLFSCRSDNFGVLLHDPATGATASIDAPEEKPILDALARRGWTLSHIFTTHHHADHVEANLALKDRFGVTIIGPLNLASQLPLHAVLGAQCSGQPLKQVVGFVGHG